jgi:hypothetical protein
MMIARRELLAAAAALAARPALALDPGVATGGYRGKDGPFEVRHALALALDNAEGFNDDARVRVLLSDREVPLSAIVGLAFPPVWGLARKGALKGLLLEFDPANRETLAAVVLTTPEPGYSMATATLSRSEGLWDRMDASPTRIAAALKPGASDDFAFSFSAPVFTNAVVSDLKGPAAAASEPVKVLLARAEALSRGDLAAARALSTEAAAEQLTSLPPETMKLAQREVAGLVRKLKAPPRVVIRRETAAVLLDKGSWASLVRVDGAWKAAD